MSRKFLGSELVVATHNDGKLKEFATLLLPYVEKVFSASDFECQDVEETGKTFLENAKLKALSVAKQTNKIALADDSGLCVNALDGQPGIFTARWGVGKDMMPGMERINKELADSLDRTAYFNCTLVLAWPDGHTEFAEGRVNGSIAWPPRGVEGHGYDPVFVPCGETRTFAEMSDAEKNNLSHRGDAFKKLIENFFDVSA